MTRMYRPLTKQRAAEMLEQARRDHRAMQVRRGEDVVPTWRETLKVAVMALVLLIAIAFLLVVGSD